MKILIFSMALAYAHAAGASPQSIAHSYDIALQEEQKKEANVPDNIGTATMLEDGTIVLSLIYQFPGGGHTMPAEFIYKPSHPEYDTILHHLGQMRPGESKSVKPWPRTKDVPPPDFNAPITPNIKEFPWPKESSVPKK